MTNLDRHIGYCKAQIDHGVLTTTFSCTCKVDLIFHCDKQSSGVTSKP